MSKHLRSSIEHSFRCKVWFGFFLVCVAVIFFPPWIISGDDSYPTPFRMNWLTRWNFHFLAYQPPDGVMHVMDNTGYCTGVSFRGYKHLNYYLLGIEVVCLGVLAQILRHIIHWHAGSTAHHAFAPRIATALRRNKKSEQDGRGDGDKPPN